jgi:hypothetical protein
MSTLAQGFFKDSVSAAFLVRPEGLPPKSSRSWVESGEYDIKGFPDELVESLVVGHSEFSQQLQAQLRRGFSPMSLTLQQRTPVVRLIYTNWGC